MSQYEACIDAKYAYAIVDLVSRKWIATHLTANPDSVAARVLFARGLDNEQLLTDKLRDRLNNPDGHLPDDDTAVPLLLAISDNGTEMRAADTRRFQAICSIIQHSAGVAPRPTKPGSRRSGVTSNTNTPTSRPSTTPPCSLPNSNGSDPTTTR